MNIDPSTILWIPVFLLMVTVLVAAHEYGHYLFAKLNRMEVEEFSIGIGPGPLFTWMRRGDTIFTVRPLPFGGFVRIKGMMPQPDGSETQVENGFYSRSPFRRFMVLLAGPVFSVLAGMAMIVALLTLVGKPDTPTSTRIGDVPPGQALTAGFRKGDTVVAINGTPVKTWGQMNLYVRSHENKDLTFVVSRNGQELTLHATPRMSTQDVALLDANGNPTGKGGRAPVIGVMGVPSYSPVGFVPAVGLAAEMPIEMVAGLASIFVHPKNFGQMMGGPGSIAKSTQEATREGWYDIISLAGVLSISLGILNLLPAHPLDGGQIMVALAEMLRGGRRLSIEVQNVISGVGLACVGMLVFAAIWVDIKRYVVPDQQTPSPSTPTNTH